MYSPSRISDDKNTTESDIEATATSSNEILVNQFDVTRVFKGKQDSLKNRSSQGKKKTSSNSKTNLGSRSGLGGFKNPHRY